MVIPTEIQRFVDLSVVVPAHEDAHALERSLPQLKAFLESLDRPFEILVSDDGTSDDSVRATALRHGCRYVRSDRNRGKGHAVRLGVRSARGRFLIFTDSDLPFGAEALGRVLHYLDFKEFEVVIGDRNLEGSTYHAEVPWARRVGSRVFLFIVGRLLSTIRFDCQCGLKGFRTNVARDLFGVARIDRFAFDTELLYVSILRNYDIKRLPVTLRSYERSQVRVLTDGARMFFDLFRILAWGWLGVYSKPSPAAAPAPVEVKVEREAA